MKTLLKNADCLEEVVDSNARKVTEIIDTAIFVPATCHNVVQFWFKMFKMFKLRISNVSEHLGVERT